MVDVPVIKQVTVPTTQTIEKIVEARWTWWQPIRTDCSPKSATLVFCYTHGKLLFCSVSIGLESRVKHLLLFLSLLAERCRDSLLPATCDGSSVFAGPFHSDCGESCGDSNGLAPEGKDLRACRLW